MKHVSQASIEKAIQKVDHLDEEGLERISETFALSQPILLGYVLSAAEEYDNESLEGLLIYYFCLLTEAFHQEGITVGEVTDEIIDEFEEPFFEALDTYFGSESEENDDLMAEFCDQPDLIQFMAMEVSTPDVDGTELNDETATQLFIVTSALIGLMGRAIKA